MGTKSNVSDELLKRASYLDAFSGSEGNLTARMSEMVKNYSEPSARECLVALADARASLSETPDSKMVVNSVYDSLLSFLGKIKAKEILRASDNEGFEKEESLSSLLAQLDNLVGLKHVKATVKDLISYHRVQTLRRQAGLRIPDRTLHIAFMGNPGTGKTTVARILGKMYYKLGILSKGHFMEVSRTDLIAGYQGQTALKVKKVIEKAKGGVLFIDEAYSLTENDHSDSYGRECLTELTKALEDYRNDLVVIVAGYTELMKAFFDSNPGLRSRFNTFIDFEDYQVPELIDIFLKMVDQDDYIVEKETLPILSDIITKQVEAKSEKFANGRYVRNLYEDIIMNQARRLYDLYDIDCIDADGLRLLTIADFALRATT